MIASLSALFALILLVLAGNQACALEMRNLQMGQEGKRVYLQYDLTGRPGEKDADVTVNLEIAGERYGAEKLTLSGDVGTKVKVGIARRIWWDLLKDMPAGYDGEVVWNVEATATAEHHAAQNIQPAHKGSVNYAPHTPPLNTSSTIFKVLDNALIDNSSGLMWAKLGKNATETLSYDRAVGFISKMNKTNFGGFNNWRLPEQHEAEQLLASATRHAASTNNRPYVVLSEVLPNLKDWNYWLNSEIGVAAMASAKHLFAWHIDIARGEVGYSNRIDSLCILPVRKFQTHDDAVGKTLSKDKKRIKTGGLVPALPGEKPQSVKLEVAHVTQEGPFKALKDMVYDSVHGLMWAKLGDDTTEKFSYDRAVSYIIKMNQEKFGGFDNWRLPDNEDVSKLFASAAAITARNGKTPIKVFLQYFPNLENWHYWQDFVTSWRSHGKGARYKKSFDIEDGTLTGDLADDGLCILPVRNAANPQAPGQGGMP